MRKTTADPIADYDLIILGAGASGMMAGIAAASFFAEEKNIARIVILERHRYAGRKLCATGNGQCNLSNTRADAKHADRFYYGENTERIAEILAGFPPPEAVTFFEKAGILCRTEPDGRIYPYCGQATAVRDALAERLGDLGVRICRSTEVTGITRESGRFLVSCEPADLPAAKHREEYAKLDGTPLSSLASDETIVAPAVFRARRVILAPGGKASAALSSDGVGYPIAESFGHTLAPVYPAIVRLEASSYLDRDLSGVKAEARLTLAAAEPGGGGKAQERRTLASESGELLFTADGISGPPVLQLSGHIRPGAALTAGEGVETTVAPEGGSRIYYVFADFFPDRTNRQLSDLLSGRIRSLPQRSVDRFFDGLLPLKLARAAAMKVFGAHSGRLMMSVTPVDIALAITVLKNLPFLVTGTAGWDSAQVTAGGIRLREIDCRTMESALCPGLYFSGEILDATGLCGGFNLQLAWASGHTAGISAARSILAETT